MTNKSNEYGYIGASPTQSSSANTGIFEVNDVTDLLNSNQYKLQTIDIQSLVIAGGGGGGYDWGGGGGAGGYRNSYASETSGDNSSTETPLTLALGANHTVTVGAGGSAGTSSPGTRATNGSDSVFSSITSLGGGLATRSGNNPGGGDGGSGGGSGGYGTYEPFGGSGTANQGGDGGRGGAAFQGNKYVGGGGGGAGGNASNSLTDNGRAGANGLSSSITGSAVTRAGGGGGASHLGGQGSGGSGGGGNGSSSNGQNGTVNTGGGAGGGDPNGGTGGSGVVILRYPNTATITVGAGLTAGTETTDGSEKYIEITAGTGTVSFS